MSSWLDGSLLTEGLKKIEEGLNQVDNIAATKLQQRTGKSILSNTSSTTDLGDADSSIGLGRTSSSRRLARAGKERAAASNDDGTPSYAVASPSSTWDDKQKRESLDGSSASPPQQPTDPTADETSLFDFGANGDGASVGVSADPVSSSTPRVAPPSTGSGAAVRNGGSSGVRESRSSPEDAPDDPEALRLRFQQVDEENRLLRREVAALSDEVKSCSTRFKSTQAALVDQREKLAAAERKLARAHTTHRDEQQRFIAMEATCQEQAERAKQLEDKLLIAEQAVTDLRMEKEMILKDHADSSAAHDGALTALRTELEALKRSRAAQEGSLEASKSATEEQLEALRLAHAQLEGKIAEANELAAGKDAALREASERAAALERQHAALNAEFSEYKNKASQVLQRKEKLIADLQAGGGGGSGALAGRGAGSGSGGADGGSELAQLREERDALRQELAETTNALQQLRADVREIEQQQDDDNELAAGQIRELEKALGAARAAQAESEQETSQRLRELTEQLEEVTRKKDLLAHEAERSATELHHLHAEVARLSGTSVGRATAELEEKVRSLTGNVVRKQSQIEALMSEKNSLAMQVEEMERRSRAETRIPMPRQIPRSRDDELSGEGGRVRTLKSIFGESSESSGQLQQTVGNAVHTLDALSIRIGVFLRRYPAARLMVILYGIILHLWVLVVIMTYTPEMHSGLEAGDHDHHPVAPDQVRKLVIGRGH